MSELDKKRKLIKDSILTIPDYPQKGVFFRDITTLLQSPEAFKASVELLVNYYKKKVLIRLLARKPVVLFLQHHWL